MTTESFNATTYAFFVAGTPKGQPRVKAFRRGAHAGVYTPPTADAWKSAVRADGLKNCPAVAFEGAVFISLHFTLPRPKSHFNSKGVKPGAPTWVTGKPDADNLAKAVLDALGDTGRWWRDDSQVVSLIVSKTYGAQTGCTIEVRGLPAS